MVWPRSPGEVTRLKVQHNSLQFSDTPAQMRADLERLFSLGSDVITWTEAHHTNALFDLLPEVGKAHGYTVHAHKFGCGVAVRDGWGRVTRKGFRHGIDGSRPGDAPYAPRGIAFVEATSHTGENIAVGAVHYITKGAHPAGFRYRENRKLARAVGEWARTRGTRLVFIGGDFNKSDRTGDVFWGEPLTTCWDELRKWPDTGHGNIDAIASRDADKQVRCVSAEAFNDTRLRLHTDHYPVVATYQIGPKRMARFTDLADVLRAADLKVVEVPGWQGNARPASTGGFNPVGNLWHHTGSKDTNPESIEDDYRYAEWLAEVGRSDLPAPLCQLSVGRDGTVYVCAAGRGNHAGNAKASGPVPAGDGNELYLGWECQNNGTEGWTPAQYDAMRVGAAATSLHYGWSAEANRAHKETSYTGKWDPGLLDMDRFRSDIQRLMEDDPMADPNVASLLEAQNKLLTQLIQIQAKTYNTLVSLQRIESREEQRDTQPSDG